jgi:hypothetical protein
MWAKAVMCFFTDKKKVFGHLGNLNMYQLNIFQRSDNYCVTAH